MGVNFRKKMWTFLDGATALSNGNEMSVNVDMETVTVEIVGTGTNKVTFEGRVHDDGLFYPIIGVSLKDLTTASEVAAKGLIYQISLDGLLSFRIRVSAYTDGVVSVKGTVVN